MIRKFTFEEKCDIIDKAILKKKNKWHLTAITWMDFDDVCQIIKLHIYKKWDMWDQQKPLEPWVGRVIANQIKNLIRNNYTNYARPCLSCVHNTGEDGCAISPTGFQQNFCHIYAKWEKSKKSGFDLKITLPLENHQKEAEEKKDIEYFSFSSIEFLNSEMKKVLTEKQYTAYVMLFFENKDDEEVAKYMGYKTTEKNRMIGYKQIKNLKKFFKQKAIEILKNKDICYGRE